MSASAFTGLEQSLDNLKVAIAQEMASKVALVPTTIAVINESTVIADTLAQAAMAALQIQVNRDFSPAWGCAAKLLFYSKGSSIPPAFWQMALLDDSDQAGALGYHDVSASGQPLGKVFVKETMADGLNWTVTFSHELLEILVDPRVNVAAEVDSVNGVPTRFYSFEVCDAVEDDSFGYKIGPVLASDFVYPAWFQPGVPGPYDHMGHVSKPFELLSGGYIGELDVTTKNGWQQFQAKAAPGARVAPNRRSDARMELRRRPRADWVYSAQ